MLPTGSLPMTQVGVWHRHHVLVSLSRVLSCSLVHELLAQGLRDAGPAQTILKSHEQFSIQVPFTVTQVTSVRLFTSLEVPSVLCFLNQAPPQSLFCTSRCVHGTNALGQVESTAATTTLVWWHGTSCSEAVASRVAVHGISSPKAMPRPSC